MKKIVDWDSGSLSYDEKSQILEVNGTYIKMIGFVGFSTEWEYYPQWTSFESLAKYLTIHTNSVFKIKLAQYWKSDQHYRRDLGAFRTAEDKVCKFLIKLLSENVV